MTVFDWKYVFVFVSLQDAFIASNWAKFRNSGQTYLRSYKRISLKFKSIFKYFIFQNMSECFTSISLEAFECHYNLHSCLVTLRCIDTLCDFNMCGFSPSSTENFPIWKIDRLTSKSFLYIGLCWTNLTFKIHLQLECEMLMALFTFKFRSISYYTGIFRPFQFYLTLNALYNVRGAYNLLRDDRKQSHLIWKHSVKQYF